MFAASRNHDTSSYSRLLEKRQVSTTSRLSQKQGAESSTNATSLTATDNTSAQERPQPNQAHLRNPTVPNDKGRPETPGHTRRPGPANTSAKRMRDSPSAERISTNTVRHKRARLAGDREQSSARLRASRKGKGPALQKGAAGHGSRQPRSQCDLCSESVDEAQHYQCQKCEGFRYCSTCFVKAPLYHPGHPFDLVQPRRQEDVAANLSDIERPGLGDTAETTRSEPVSDVNQEHRSGAAPGRITYSNTTLNCDFCSASLTGVYHQCQECPSFRYCRPCFANVAAYHGHDFDQRHAGDGPRLHPGRHGRVDQHSKPGQHNAHRAGGEHEAQAAGGSRTRHDTEPPSDVAGYTIHIPLCSACQKRLSNLRWECRECTDTHFCSKCRATHPQHKMKAFTRPILSGETSSCPSDVDAESDMDTQSGAGTTDDRATGSEDEEDGASEGDSDEDRRHKADRSRRQTGPDQSQALDRGEPDSDVEDEGAEQNNVIRRPRSQVSRSVATQPPHVKVPLPAFAGFYKQIRVLFKAATGTDPEDLDLGGVDEGVSTSRQARQLCGPKRPEAAPAGRHREPQLLRMPQSLLKYPIELGTLDGDEDDSVVGRRTRGAIRQEAAVKHGRGYRWTSEDRRHLREMEQKGWTPEEIGAKLGRTPLAIRNQLRKLAPP